MTSLVPLRGVLGVVAKAADADPDGAAELWRITLYEALADLTEAYGPVIKRDFTAAAAVQAEAARHALVRTAVAKRLAGEEIDALVDAAAHLTLLEPVAKAEDTDTRRKASARQPRDHGRFAQVAHDALDAVATFTRKPDSESESDLSRVTRPSEGIDRRVYRQLGVTGNALATSGALAGQPGAALLGHAASLVGELGPQAEQILGPGLKRTSYRYRGTERRPDRGLQLASKKINTSLDQLAATERTDPAAALELRRALAQGDGPLAETLKARDADTLSVDQLRLQAQTTLAARSLADDIPTLEAARLSLASGKMPPSRGVIIDADGDVVAEAQGYDGDHYLPFDLKNLRHLHGGAYVRTRATGGPTDEDVYTALLTGARQLTVISHSGVFTVELDPNLRGGRRYSDKARAMTQRYARLLAAVGSGQVYAEDIPPADQAKLRQRFYASHPNLDKDQLEAGFNRELDRERTSRQFRSMTEDEILTTADTQARAELAAQPGGGAQLGQRRRDLQEDLRRKQAADTIRAYRLDGDGYTAALTSLKTEFPFFIRRLSTTPLLPWLSRQGFDTKEMRPYRGVDIGRTHYRGVKATAAREVGWGKPEKADEPAKPKPATAGTGGPDTGAMSAAPVADGTVKFSEAFAKPDTRFAREINYAIAQLIDLTRSLPTQFPPAAAEDATEANAGSSPQFFVAWATQNPNDVGAAVLKNPKLLDVLERTAADVKRSTLTDADKDAVLGPLGEKTAAARAITAGWTKPSGDPVLTEPVNDRPVVFTEIDALGDRMANYTAYLATHPDVAAAVKQLDGVEKPAEEITAQIDAYNDMADWGHKGFAPDARGRVPEGDADKARQVHEYGTKSEPYAELAALQKAFAFLTQRQALAALTGAEVTQDGDDGDPKVVGKRAPSQLVVHRRGSPVAKAWASTRSRRPPPTATR